MPAAEVGGRPLGSILARLEANFSYDGGNSMTHCFFLHTLPPVAFHQLIQFGLMLRELNQRPQLPFWSSTFSLNFFSIVPFPIPNSREVVSHPSMAWRKRMCWQTKDPNSVFTCLTFQILHLEFFFFGLRNEENFFVVQFCMINK